MDVNWWAFLGVVLLAYVIPGPDFAVILRAATRGWRSGLAAATGAQTGLFVHMVLAAVGLSVILAQHAAALTVIRIVGGLYLCYLGGRLVLSTLRRSGTGSAQGDATAGGQAYASAFRHGFLTNVTNPKAVLFFASVLPQFITTEGLAPAIQVAVLGVADVALGFLPWAVVIGVGARLSAVMTRATVKAWWDRVTGTFLAGLGGTVIVKG